MTWLKENIRTILSGNYDYQKRYLRVLKHWFYLNIVLYVHSLGSEVKPCFFLLHNLEHRD